MPLPISGPLSLFDVADEVWKSRTGFNMNQLEARLLANKITGPVSMSDFYGKGMHIFLINPGTQAGFTGFIRSPSSFDGLTLAMGDVSDQLFGGHRISAIIETTPGILRFELEAVVTQDYFKWLSLNGINYSTAGVSAFANWAAHPITGRPLSSWAWALDPNILPGLNYEIRMYY